MGGLRAGYYTSRDRFDDIHSVTLWDDNHVDKVEVYFGRKVAEDEVQQELFQSVIASYSGPRPDAPVARALSRSRTLGAGEHERDV